MKGLAWFRALKVSPRRRPLVLLLLLGLLFELCVLVGVLASPLLHEWMPRLPVRTADMLALTVRYRQSLYRHEDDLRIGECAPRLSLRTATGERLDLAALRGKRVALIFARDGSG